MNGIAEVLGNIYPPLGTLRGVPLFIFLTVIVLTAAFLLGYLVQGTKVWWQLKSVVRAIQSRASDKTPPPPAHVGQAFKWEPLKHLWEEYADTLHELRKAGSGEVVLTEVRATVPADTMFTRDALVDSRLFDDFTRHLPGVLTGLGIIGTFSGLLSGLSKFKPTPIETAVNGLGPLLQGVQHAFIASGFAIACAMGVVFISRLVLAYFYRLVEELTRGIDSLYTTGAGEEYLARLVKSSEQNSANTAQLKDALVEDLNKMMTNLVERQIAAQEASVAALGQHIGESISAAIAEPMRRVGEVMEMTSRGNGEQVNSMLETLLTGFMAKLEDTFGGQMRGVNDQMQRSIDAMASVQSSLQGLLADIKQTNEQATSSMSGTLEEAMKKAADNQQLLTDQMREFVQDFRRLVTEEQNKSKEAMHETVAQVLGEVTAAMNSLEGLRRAAAVDEAGRTDRLANQTTQLVGGLTNQVESLLGAVSDQVSQTQKNIDALGQVSLRAIEGMNQGALTMGSAAQRFETAGGAVTSVFERSSKVVETLGAASSALQAASTAVQQGFEQYDSTRRTVDAHVVALTALIESAKREAGVSQELVASIKASAEAMRKSEAESRAHLDQVNSALVKAFADFGNALVSQVKSTIAETDRHLAQGTGHLNGVVQELASAVQRMKRA
ncbi:anti-phage ZorAB system protein ZorA [Burkholderia pseudomallei]|uniref:anti-phage ZorAB system protein ZorA n=1 Tax=Burkholderia pseudomallei TaxID=28450 RepID=UPI0005385DF4|nr:anti-phage ZorAB system protein ZorA [Burkholderia pseudomallei]KGX39518.1 putative methyl-accepting chemotaxis sensory transducer [Burkholderia pseudomallei MSHR2138]